MAVSRVLHFVTVKEYNEYMIDPNNQDIVAENWYLLNAKAIKFQLEILDDYYGVERKFGDGKDGGVVYVVLSGSLSDNNLCNLNKVEYVVPYDKEGNPIKDGLIDEEGYIGAIIFNNNEYSSIYIIKYANLSNEDKDRIHDLI